MPTQIPNFKKLKYLAIALAGSLIATFALQREKPSGAPLSTPRDYPAIAAAFTGLTAYSFMIFNLLCAPCFAAMGAIKS